MQAVQMCHLCMQTEQMLSCVAYAPLGDRVAVAGLGLVHSRRPYRILLATTIPPRTICINIEGALSGAFAPCGEQLVAGCLDGRVRIIEARS